MTDNGSSTLTKEDLRLLVKEAMDETIAKPVQAVSVDMTPQERASRCEQAIKDALEQYNCSLVPSWLQITPTQQVRSESVQIMALEAPKV